MKGVKEKGLAEFIERDSESMTIKIKGGEELKYQFISMIEFSSDRKMMTVAVKDEISGKYYVFVKGADEKISAIRSESDLNDPESSSILEKVHEYGGQGLRTLVFAMREMSAAEFDEIDWEDKMLLPEKLERDLEILGCTGVLDEL